MKTKKTFRLSDEAIAVLASQPNATEYLEEVLRGKAPNINTTNSSAPETNKPLTEGRVLYLIQQEVAKITPPYRMYPPQPQSQNTTNSSVPINRKSQITTEIARLEAERDEKLEWCQDVQEGNNIALECNQQTDKLWAQFHAIKDEDNTRKDTHAKEA